MAHFHVPGVCIAVINLGKIEWAKGYGVKEIGGNTPVTPETLFQAGSISKPVTTLGTLQLVEKGALDLDAPVNDRLKSWNVPENEFTAKEKVTLRRLLSHTAGLSVSGFPGYADSDPIPTPVQILNGEKPANTAPVRVDLIPGSEWRYSGGGFVVIQVLVADVTEKPFQDFMKETVLTPLGMTHSTFQQPLPQNLTPFAACGHDSNGKANTPRWRVRPELAPGGMWTTAQDLGRFVMELQKSANGASNKVISQAMTQTMMKKVHSFYGLGLVLDGSTNEDRSFSHSGGNEGYTCDFFGYIHRGQGLVVLTNSTTGGGLVEEIQHSVATAYGWPGFQTKELAVIEIIPAKLSAYVGDFRAAAEPETPFLITLEGNQLHFNSSETGDWALYPISETEFVYLDGEVHITFVRGPDGRYDQIRLMGQELSRKKIRSVQW